MNLDIFERKQLEFFNNMKNEAKKMADYFNNDNNKAQYFKNIENKAHLDIKLTENNIEYIKTISLLQNDKDNKNAEHFLNIANESQEEIKKINKKICHKYYNKYKKYKCKYMKKIETK